MKQYSRKCLKACHDFQQIEYICKYPLCEDRFLCSKCALEDTHWHDQSDSHIVLKSDYDEKQLQQIKDAKYTIHDIPNAYDDDINAAAVSNNLKYIVTSGQSKILNVWDYHTKKRIKSIKFGSVINHCMFTEDSKLLYVACIRKLYQIQVYNQFKKFGVKNMHKLRIQNFYCISNKYILTSSYDGTIIQTDYMRKKQLFKIQAHNKFNEIRGLDFNKRTNIIASGSDDKSIKLWNVMTRELIIQKQFAHNNKYEIIKVIFLDIDQLISIDSNNYIIMWNIDYKAKQLKIKKIIINDKCDVSLILDQYLLIMTHSYYLQVYNLQLQLIKQFHVGHFHLRYLNTVQPNSMKAILFIGDINDFSQLFVCKIKLE